MSNITDRFERAKERMDKATKAYTAAQSEFIASDREYQEAWRAVCMKAAAGVDFSRNLT